MTTIHMDRGEPYREEPGRYRTTDGCSKCRGTIWRAIAREVDGWRLLRCSGCGYVRPFSVDCGTVTFTQDAA